MLVFIQDIFNLTFCQSNNEDQMNIFLDFSSYGERNISAEIL